MSRNAVHVSLVLGPAVSSHSCRLSISGGTSQTGRLMGLGGTASFPREITAALHTSASSPHSAFLGQEVIFTAPFIKLERPSPPNNDVGTSVTPAWKWSSGRVNGQQAGDLQGGLIGHDEWVKESVRLTHRFRIFHSTYPQKVSPQTSCFKFIEIHKLTPEICSLQTHSHAVGYREASLE